MAEAITFEFPVSASEEKPNGREMGTELRNRFVNIKDDGTAFRNFLRVVAQRLSQELHSSVESGDRRP